MNSVENFKIQVGKYNNIILNEGRPGGQELYADKVIQDLKKELQDSATKSVDEGIINSLISLRVNALQVSQEYRDDMIKAWIKNDILNIQKDGDHDYALKIMDNNDSRVVQNITSLISYIASTKEGIDYLLPHDKYDIVKEVAKVYFVIVLKISLLKLWRVDV